MLYYGSDALYVFDFITGESTLMDMPEFAVNDPITYIAVSPGDGKRALATASGEVFVSIRAGEWEKVGIGTGG